MKQRIPGLHVLQTCYDHVSALGPYLKLLLDVDLEVDPPPELTPALELLRTGVVAWNGNPQPKKLAVYPALMDMFEVIDRMQAHLLRVKAPPHMITAGYFLTEKHDSASSRSGVVNKWVNTIVTALQAPEWEALLQRVGVDAIVHLLTEVSVYVALPNGCFCQMTGEPVHFRKALETRAAGALQNKEVQQPKKHPAPTESKAMPPTKRQKLVRDGSFGVSRFRMNHTTEKFRPADHAFQRAKIFYARPQFIPHTARIIVGLPTGHILHTLAPSFSKQTDEIKLLYAKQDSRILFIKANRLATCIFPMQFKRSPTSANVPSQSSQPGKKKSEPQKTPKRIKHLLPLLDQLVHKHHKCAYAALRELTCPSKVKDKSRNIDESTVLEMMSEKSIILSQRQMNSSKEYSSLTIGQISFSKFPQPKPRFCEFACTTNEVYRYVVLVTKAIIPNHFWGSTNNFKLVMKHVKQYINCRRYETLTLHYVLQGFRTSDCDWLSPNTKGALSQSRVCVSDSLKRRELLEEFVQWYFEEFLMPLMKTSFYITESSAFRNRTLYFRQDDWHLLCRPLVERLSANTFVKLTKTEAEETLRQRQLGFSFVRLLPKDTGVRPIVNLRHRKMSRGGAYKQSINQILQAAFQILTYEKTNQSHLLGAAVFGPDEIYTRLKGFKLNLIQRHNGNLPKLYFVKMDVQACFDTIEQGKLLKIIKELLSEDAYRMQRYGKVSVTAGKIRRGFVRKALPEDEHPHFLKYAQDLARALRNTLLVDQVRYGFEETRHILLLLEEHITENIVKIGQGYYRQVVGIPQGSILSTILCSFFYGDLERSFGSFTDNSTGVLLRLIDDYLYVTTDPAKARKFLAMMNRGHPEYGCFVSKEKTLTNFDHGIEVMNIVEPNQKAFPWCGFLIDMKDLSLTVDYSRYKGLDLANTSTIERGRCSGAAFNFKMLQLAKSRSHIIFTDSLLNNETTVYKNIYQNFLLSALKMHTYLCLWSANRRKNAKFIQHTVQRMIHFTFSSVLARARGRIAKLNNGKTAISKTSVIWLGNHAFRYIISRYPQRYASLLASLTFELSRPCYRGQHRRFQSLIKDASKGLEEKMS